MKRMMYYWFICEFYSEKDTIYRYIERLDEYFISKCYHRCNKQ